MTEANQVKQFESLGTERSGRFSGDWDDSHYSGTHTGPFLFFYFFFFLISASPFLKVLSGI